MQARNDIPQELQIASLAQWALESARGTSLLSVKYWNFGGLKYRARMVGHADPVDYRGSDGELATYCHFDSVEAFVSGYWHFISSGPYEGWKAFETDAAGYIRHLKRCGYAADPMYVDKVLSLFGEARTLLLGASSEAPQPHAAAAGVPARLAVVVGHNTRAQGASSEEPLARTEYVFNSEVARHMREEAAEHNLDVEVFFREAAGGYSAEIRNAYAKVAAWKPNCVLELHFNSASAQASGSEVLYRANDPTGRSLGAEVLQEVVATLGLPDRGLKSLSLSDRGGASAHALVDVPTILCEPFFGSSPSDCRRMGTVGQEGLALAYLRGVRDWANTRL